MVKHRPVGINADRYYAATAIGHMLNRLRKNPGVRMLSG